MTVRLVCIVLLCFLSFSSAQVRLDEEFPVSTLQYTMVLPVKHLSEEAVITRLNEMPQAKSVLSHGWESTGSSFNSFKEIVGSAFFDKINKTKDKNCNFSVSVVAAYNKGNFEVEITAQSFDRFLSGGRPQSQSDAEHLAYYQKMTKEFIPLITEYLTGKKTIQENHDEMLNRAADLAAEGKTPEALKIYSKVLASDPDNSLALFNKAHALFSLKKYTEALNIIRTAEKSKNASGFDVIAYKNLKIQILIVTSQNEKALSEINKIGRDFHNTDPEKIFEAAKDDKGEVFFVPSEKTELFLRCAGYLLMLNRKKEALNVLKKYEELIPDHNRILLSRLFSYYCQLKLTEDAERIRLLIAKDDPSSDLKCKG